MNSLVALYDELAPDYERTRVPRFRPFVKRLMQLYDTRPGSHVLDAGCGTGLAATLVAPRVGRTGHILGVDASPRMLEIARHKAQGFGFTQCEFVQGDITHLDVEPASFDLVLCSFALWGDPAILSAGFARVLRPHGVLLIQNWGAEGIGVARTFNETIRRFATTAPPPALAELRTRLATHRAAWAALDEPAAYENLFRSAGFSGATAAWFSQSAHFATLGELVEFHSLGTSSHAELAAMSDDARGRALEAISDALRPLETPRGLDVEWRAIQLIARV